jgi:hypothetical protein
MQNCLVPDDEFLAMPDGGGMVAPQEQAVEASTASCSYVPSDDAGTPAMAYDTVEPPPANAVA